jgi:hypothetical protein
MVDCVIDVFEGHKVLMLHCFHESHFALKQLPSMLAHSSQGHYLQGDMLSVWSAASVDYTAKATTDHLI